MEMALQLLEKFGPSGLLAGIAVYLIFFVTKNYKDDIDSRVKFADAINSAVDEMRRIMK